MDTVLLGDVNGWTVLTIVGLGVVSALSRSLFFLSEQDWTLPPWAQRGLQYAPIAALSAVIAPEIVITHGVLISSLQDARVWAVLAGAAYYFWRKGAGQAVLGTIVSGMLVYLPLHIGLGW